MKLPNLIHLLLSFYATVGIPLIYLLILGIIALTPEKFPFQLGHLMQWLSRPEVRMFNLIIATAGAILWLWAYLSLGKHFGVLPMNKMKVTTGPYKFLSHPMYVGIFLTFTGLGLAVLSVPGLLINWFVLTPLNWYRARKESRLLI